MKKVLQNSLNSIKSTAKTAAAVCVCWTKRTGIALSLIGVVALGASAYTVKVALPHTHNIYSAAKLVDGEARGETYQGQKAVFGSLLTRVLHKQFPDTIHAVAYQPYSNNAKLLQYNAMGDEFHEDLSTEPGQMILLKTAWWYAQAQLGIFTAPKEAREAHSYCVPSACERQKGYFGTLKRIGQIDNHVFYGDCPCFDVLVVENKNLAPETSIRPKSRPAVQEEIASSAPKQSLRPTMRPSKQSAVLNEQIEQTIVDVIIQNN